jgi:hypothetical protein
VWQRGPHLFSSAYLVKSGRRGTRSWVGPYVWVSLSRLHSQARQCVILFIHCVYVGTAHTTTNQHTKSSFFLLFFPLLSCVSNGAVEETFLWLVFCSLALIRFWGRWLFGEVSTGYFVDGRIVFGLFHMCSEDHIIVYYCDVCRREPRQWHNRKYPNGKCQNHATENGRIESSRIVIF